MWPDAQLPASSREAGPSAYPEGDQLVNADRPKPRVFISFRYRPDESAFRRLCLLLERAGFEVITYHKAGYRWSLKSGLRSHLGALIASCDCMILLLSSGTLRSHWVRFECRQALKHQLAIRPLLTCEQADVIRVIRTLPRKTVQATKQLFRRLLDRKCRLGPGELSNDDLKEEVLTLWDDLRLPCRCTAFEPEGPDTRLGWFHRRILRDFEVALPASGLALDDQLKLFRGIGEIFSPGSDRDLPMLEQAQRIIEQIRRLEPVFSRVQSYHLLLLQANVRLVIAENQTDPGLRLEKFHDARETFRGLREHEQRERHADLGFGIASYELKYFGDAIEALTAVWRSDRTDLDVLRRGLRAHLAARAEVPDEMLQSLLEKVHAGEAGEGADRHLLMLLGASRRRGASFQRIAVRREADASGAAQSDWVEEVDRICFQARWRGAAWAERELRERVMNEENAYFVCRSLARLHMAHGNLRAAEDTLEDLLTGLDPDGPDQSSIRADLMMCGLLSGQDDVALEFARVLVGGSIFVDGMEAYYRGLAHWISSLRHRHKANVKASGKRAIMAFLESRSLPRDAYTECEVLQEFQARCS